MSSFVSFAHTGSLFEILTEINVTFFSLSD